VTGTLLLAGSGEFLPPMAEVDVELLRLTPGRPPSVAILPTAAGQELTVQSWIDDGVRHFTRLGCRAYGVPVVDRAGADNPDYAAAIESAHLIYLSGGSPGYLIETLRDGAVWRAIQAARRRGSTLAGSSAGAMAQGGFSPLGLRRRRPEADAPRWIAALGVLPNLGVIPHYDRLTRLSPERLAPLLESAPPGLVVFGIDENTVLLIHGSDARVLGHGTVTRWRDRQPQLFEPGDSLPRADDLEDEFSISAASASEAQNPTPHPVKRGPSAWLTCSSSVCTTAPGACRRPSRAGESSVST